MGIVGISKIYYQRGKYKIALEHYNYMIHGLLLQCAARNHFSFPQCHYVQGL